MPDAGKGTFLHLLSLLAPRPTTMMGTTGPLTPILNDAELLVVPTCRGDAIGLLMSTSQTARAEALATQKNALPSNTTVIGLFGPEQALKALVRFSSGRLREIEVGDRLASHGHVVAIDTKGIMIEKSGVSQRLTLLAS